MRKVLCAILAAWGFASLTVGADVQPVAKPPGLTFMDGDKTASLDLAKVEIHTVIKGYLAETTEVLTFKNPLGRVLAGDLDFPLPEGATVSGFGLDVGGVMVDGVPVPKEKARITFEKEMRKGVDPGLAEATVGNSFRTRVYPIPANGTRAVKVQYVEDLGAVAIGDGAVSYRLPLRWGKVIGEFSCHIEVMDCGAPPVVRGAVPFTAVEAKDGKYVADVNVTGVDFASDLVVALPDAPGKTAVVEKRTHRTPTVADIEADASKAGVLDKPEYYFALYGEIPGEADDEVSLQQKVPRVGVCWDVSFNRAQTDKTRELGVLAKAIKRMDPSQVDLILFSNTAQPTQTFTIKNGDASAVIAAINAATYDGGLNLSCLKMGKEDGAYLLFSSGLVNIGGPSPAAVESPVYVMTNDATADYAVLKRIAADSGGQFFNLPRVSDDSVMTDLGLGEGYSLISVQAKDGEIADVYPKGRQQEEGRISIAGRLMSPTATVVLNYGVGNVVQDSVTYVIKQSDATETGIVPRLWAQKKLADLAMDEGRNEEEISAIGRDFGLVTANTSLLVLENLQQYLTYGIVPPTNRPDIYQGFVDQIKQQASVREKTKEERIQQVLGMWNDRVKWWEAEYKYEKGFRYHDDGKDATGLPETGDGMPPVTAGVPATQPDRRYDIRDLSIHDESGSTVVPGSVGPRGGVFQQRQILTQSNGAAPQRFDELDAASENDESGVSISIKPWDPNTPYLAAMKSAPVDQAYPVYLNQRDSFASAPAFYLDCADFLLTRGQRELGVRVLTDIPALKLESPELLRIAGYRLRQIGEYDLAVDLFEKVLRMRPEEPQSYRDLALALADRAGSIDVKSSGDAADRAAADEERALGLLYQVVLREPDQRFPGLEVIAMEEANEILMRAGALGRTIANPIDPRLLKLMDLDVRVVMSWDTADTDIDLWVTEPSGEKCFYGHNRTAIGGMLSNDFTQGYGPEEYNVRHAMPGKYLIQSNFYGTHSQELNGPTTVHVTVITHWGRPDEKRQALTVRLTDNKETVDIGSVTVE